VRKEVVDLFCRMCGDSGKHVTEPFKRVDAVFLAGGHERINNGSPPGSVV